ncbi:MAG: hypothetical protein QM726_05140 [Chitinophagaceae bacterium]
MPKIQLSTEEMQLVSNSHWILTKHRIIEKVYHLFGNLSEQMQSALQVPGILPEAVLSLPPKISKGEQYEAMPYVVLDYPRYFTKEDVLAVRSFFWWGHYFSITLHLKGNYCKLYYKKIAAAVAAKKLNDHYFSVSGNEFSFNLESENYTQENVFVRLANEEQSIPFLKLSYKIPFEQWPHAEMEFMHAFQQLLNLMQD